MKKIIFLLVLALISVGGFAQDEYTEKRFQFIAYEKIRAWTGVAAAWDSPNPVVHLYNPAKYQGHADFVSKGLNTGITFKQFKDQVKTFATRKYLPFFLFDAREHPLTIEGKTYTWALMLEDYAYTDNADQMGKTVLRLLQLVKDHIAHSAKAPEFNHGVVVLSNNQKSKPNTEIALMLNQQGFPNRTIQQLTGLFGTAKTNVLNEGVAYGYLRYVPGNDEKNIYPAATDIVIYEKLPARVPPVSGIITLEPQTPLSHINLLAKNRKTINLYLQNMQQLPGLEKLKNQLVKIECSHKKIMVSKTTEAEAKKFWAKRVMKVSIPLPSANSTKIVDLASVKKEETAIENIGAKAGNYALIQKHFPRYVRPGFAIPFYWYQHSVKICGADTLIKTFLDHKKNMDAVARRTALEKIRSTILNSRPDPTLVNEITALVQQHFKGSRIRLRSSTNCEDLPEFNGAGLYVSKGYNDGDSIQKLEKKILQVYASLWSDAAFDEREFYHIDHSRAAMAILINEAFSNEYANGVLLTIPQKKGFGIFINTQAGGDLVTNPVEGQVPESVVFKHEADTVYTTESRSNVKDIFVSGEHDQLLLELKQLAVDMQKLFDQKNPGTAARKFGIDLEFRLMQENGIMRLYVKQARLLGQVLPE